MLTSTLQIFDKMEETIGNDKDEGNEMVNDIKLINLCITLQKQIRDGTLSPAFKQQLGKLYISMVNNESDHQNQERIHINMDTPKGETTPEQDLEYYTLGYYIYNFLLDK